MCMKRSETKIFIIEDNELESMLLSQELRLSFTHASLFIYKSVENALEHVDEKPDYIILDHFLQGMNGVDSIPEIKKQLPASRIIVASSQISVDVYRNAYLFGADVYYKKNKLLSSNVISFINLYRKN